MKRIVFTFFFSGFSALALAQNQNIEQPQQLPPPQPAQIEIIAKGLPSPPILDSTKVEAQERGTPRRGTPRPHAERKPNNQNK